MDTGNVMSVRPVLGMSEMLHERPTRASEAWKMEARRATRKTLDGVFILEIVMYLSVAGQIVRVRFATLNMFCFA